MIRELSRDEFLGSFHKPMQPLDEDDELRPVPLGEYVEECIAALHLPTSREEIEIHHVYLSGDRQYTHVLMYFGEENRYLVVVLKHPEDVIVGHRVLDLNEEYGISRKK